ncbi:type I pullulanase [Alkalihalobacterium alkalinitrilicum]|uniref:type I pullulanase n=1 Tax=Alkalihalobacterium alkalinitrilicum TaxID=427920 RepID=UPI001303BAA9|nr:type I pullulanase [Alkalihalobacterium alkalinitrilicum]
MRDCRVEKAIINEVDQITVIMSSTIELSHDFFKLRTGKKEIPIVNVKEQSNRQYMLQLLDPVEFGKEYTLDTKLGDSLLVEVGSVVRTNAFDDLFYYEDNDLGATYSQSSTTFKVWAPTATEVRLIVFNEWQEEKGIEIPMVRKQKGVWKLSLPGDQNGLFYLYKVCVNGIWNEAVDPYAKALTINGLKGMVIDLSKTNPVDWPRKLPFHKRNETIIYEAHIRDFTIARTSGIDKKGKYIGWTEEHTTGSNGTVTGLDYIKQLGITHVQLLPINDFGSIDEEKQDSYNWGYDPTHFFVPEGSYSIYPEDPYARIIEVKNLISTLHQHQLRVILDVVYNHIYIWQVSDFEKIVPGYFFRYDEKDQISNGTGVGNDIASERKMVQKFILDCVTYWAQEYYVDGFRFDLMGILDLETMKKIADRLYEINPSIVLLGEGWNLPTAYPAEKRAVLEQAKMLPNISFFNDRFRDRLKGSSFNHLDKGFINGNAEQTESTKEVISGTMGMFHPHDQLFSNPQQSINYIECHDNHTLWDKLTLSNGGDPEAFRYKMHRLGTSIVLTAQGIPFIHAGQEFFRTKYGVENSYNAPDSINAFDWDRKAKFIDNVEYIKGLNSIRKKHPAFRLNSMEQVEKHMKPFHTPPHVIGYMLDNLSGIDEWNRIAVIHNGSWSTIELNLPYKGEWFVIVDDERADLIPLYSEKETSIKILPISTKVLFQV